MGTTANYTNKKTSALPKKRCGFRPGATIFFYVAPWRLQHLLKHGRSQEDRNPARLEMARQFWFLETKFDFVWDSHYVNTKYNHHSDALSRWGDLKQRQKFYKLIENTGAVEITINNDMFNFSDDLNIP